MCGVFAVVCFSLYSFLALCFLGSRYSAFHFIVDAYVCGGNLLLDFVGFV